MVDSIGFYMLYNSGMSVKNIVFDINGVLVNRPVMKNLLKILMVTTTRTFLKMPLSLLMFPQLTP